MGMVKQFYMDYCEAMHPNDLDAQDRLFEQLCNGTCPVPTMEEAQAAIKRFYEKRDKKSANPFD